MAAADDQARSGVSRRDALRLLAASTTTVAAGSLIVSQPAFADSGSETCRFGFPNGSPSVTVTMANANGNNPDFLSITVSNVSGTCPCTPTQSPQIEYAYYITLPNASGGTGWTDWNAVSVSSPSVLWRGSGDATISVGVRTTCRTGSAPESGTAVRCGYGTGTFTARNNRTEVFNFSLGTTNGNSAPAGLPSCDSAPFGAPQLQSRALTADGTIVIQPGAGIAPTLDPNAVDEPSVDLGTPDTDTTTSTTTTTTDKPGNGPKPKPKPNESTTTTPATTTSAPSTTAQPPTSTAPASTTTTTSTTLSPGG
jgi:hypothetical protein